MPSPSRSIASPPSYLGTRQRGRSRVSRSASPKILPSLRRPDSASSRQATTRGRLQTAASEGFLHAWGHEQFIKQRKVAKALLHKRAEWEGVALPPEKDPSAFEREDRDSQIIPLSLIHI